jgi:hypothetical protein
MNLTLIKNFFLSNDRKSIEPAKVSRVLRRSFRIKRTKQSLESNREKRKSGKTIFICVDYSSETPMQSSSRRRSPTRGDESLKQRHLNLLPQIRLSTARNGRYRGPFQISDWALSEASTRASLHWCIDTSPAATCKKNLPKAADLRRKFKLTTKVICC